ncbi:MAG: metalloregulator ArsR/SmtB family transcription factor [Spirochaetia bacterium]|jgi:DNA-binding transcriptional ArsR family regulator
MQLPLRIQHLLQTLGDANRLRILHFIGGEHRSVSEIVAAVGLSQPLASHHLRAMREKGILETRREGPFIYYALRDSRLLEALGFLILVAAEDGDDDSANDFFPCPAWVRRHITDTEN